MNASDLPRGGRGRSYRRGMRLALGLSAAVLALAGCASDSEGSEESQAGSADDLPECSEVWIDGESLDSEYSGCLVDGQPSLPSFIPCESGDQFVDYEEAYFAVVGGEITEASTDSAEYAAAFEECTGEPA